jgi:hypothetical protein
MFNIAVPYCSGREAWTGCIASSLAVRESHRGKGIAVEIGRRFLDQPEAGLLVGTGSSNAALSLWHKLGMKSLRRTWTRTRLLIPIHKDEFVRHFGPRVPHGRWLAASAHAATRAGVRALSRLDRNSVFECRAYETAASLADDGLERLFTENEVHRRFRREDLHWYYFAPVRSGVRIRLLCAHLAGTIVGMMVLRITESPVTRYDVMEFKCHRSYPGAARAMLSAMTVLAAEEGAGYASVRPFSSRVLSALPVGSFIPTYSHFAYVWSVRYTAIAARRDAVYTSPGDGDCCFL